MVNVASWLVTVATNLSLEGWSLMPNRAPSEGSVYQRKSDGWVAVAIPLPDGKKKVFYSDEKGLPF